MRLLEKETSGFCSNEQLLSSVLSGLLQYSTIYCVVILVISLLSKNTVSFFILSLAVNPQANEKGEKLLIAQAS